MTILGPTSPPSLPIGVSDYAALREGGYAYVDKSRWIADLLTTGAKAVLVPRPRRFGKTLNLSTLRYFVERVADEERERRTTLFDDTWVWTARGGALRTHFARYPVIEISFKDAKEDTWEACWDQVRVIVQEEVRRVWELHALGDVFADVDHVLNEFARLVSEQPGHTSIVRALHNLSRWLHEASGERVVILVDEYDAPLNAAWQNGYLDSALPFFRGFLSCGFKDNSYLFKGALTGILRVAKEGIFSGLNNLCVASILGDLFHDQFGFTESDVEELALVTGRTQDLLQIRDWYNGYRFGARNVTTMYNPWSVLHFLAERGFGPQSFWKNTSDNAIIRDLLRRHSAGLGPAIQTLLTGGTVDRRIEESLALQHLERNANSVIELLFFSGYLTPTEVVSTDRGLVASLRIPNREVRTIFEDTFVDWLNEAGDFAAGSRRGPLADAILNGHEELVEEVLGQLLVRMLSVHDVAGDRVEAVYQAFLIGLLVQLEATHRVTSNREAGYGRADVLIAPKAAGPGAVLELKRVLSRETPESALERALEQLRERDYAAEVRAAGATRVHQYGVVFDGKRCWVRMLT